MKTLKVVIIEDEKNGQEALTALIEMYCPSIHIVGMADSIESAVIEIDQHQPDLIFLDIMLGNENGFDLLNILGPRKLHLIFTTSMDCYAINAFKANAIDYLLKPIEPQRLVDAVKKFENLFDLEKDQIHLKHFLQTLNNDKIKRICIPSKNSGVTIIDINEIKYIEGSGTYSTFHLINDKKITASKNLGHYYTILDKSKFYRSHQSFIVNIDYISRIDPANGVIELKNNIQISLTKNRKNTLMSLME